MSMKLFELKATRQHALNKADAILKAAETAGRELTKQEALDVDAAMTAVRALDPQISAITSKNTLLQQLESGKLIPGTPTGAGMGGFQKINRILSQEYTDAFYAYLGSKGTRIEAGLYEGSDTAGGYAVPVTVDGQIVPLAPQEMGVRSLAMVIPTSMDIKVPQKAGFGQAALKAENASFTEVDPTLGQFTLSRIHDWVSPYYVLGISPGRA